MWPSVVVVLGTMAMITFRAELRNFLGRTQSVGKGWLVATPIDQKAIAAQPEGVQELLQAFDSQLMREQEASIRADLSSRKLEGHPEVEKILIRHLAAVQISLAFEQTYSIIWGGQVALLETLNQLAGGVDRAEIQAIYEKEYRGVQPFYRDVTFEAYLQFLTAHLLVRDDGNRLHISVVGREFLKWIVDQGKQKRNIG